MVYEVLIHQYVLNLIYKLEPFEVLRYRVSTVEMFRRKLNIRQIAVQVVVDDLKTQ